MQLNEQLTKHYGSVRSRLMKPQNAIKTVVTHKDVADEAFEGVSSKMLVSVLRSRLYEAEKQVEAKQAIIRKLELDLSDAHARLLTQASQICIQHEAESEIAAETEPKKPVKQIIEEVLSGFPGVTWEEVKSIRRTNRLVKPRQMCMYELYRQRPDLSFPSLGRIFGGRDHTTILHSVNKVRAERERDAA